MTDLPADFREMIDVAMRDGARLRIRCAPPHETVVERTVLPRAWTRGSEFFAWDYDAGVYHTFDAAFVTECRRVDDDKAGTSRASIRAVQVLPPGRGEPLPPPVVTARRAEPRRRFVLRGRTLIAACAAAALVSVIFWWRAAGVDGDPLERIFGTPTAAPTPTALPTATATPTSDVRRIRAVTATAVEASRLATEEAPCHPRNGRCFELADGTLVMAIPPEARLLVYSRPMLDPALARQAMRHHILAIEGRDATGDWLLLRMTDGESFWVQAAAVGVFDAVAVVQEWRDEDAAARPTASRRRTPTPQP